MNDGIRRWLRAIGTTAFVCTALTASTGCGALKAAANPKVAWALSDPAPMSVVVRRADVAEKTAENVDRLMTSTPADESSEWIGKVGPDKDAATAQLVELRKSELYMQNVKIVAAEVWAKSLGDLAPKQGKAAPAAPAPAPAAEPTKEASADAKGKHDKHDKHGKVAKNDKPEGKHGKKGAKTAKPEAADAPPADAPAAPPPAAPAATAKYPSLLAAIDKDLGDSYQAIMENKKTIGELKGDIAKLDAANDEKGISDADKKANKDRMDQLDKQVDKIDDETSKMAKDFISKAKSAAEKAPAPVREKIGPVLVNLAQAVEDANIANGAAAVRYPLAATSLIDSAKTMVGVYAADVIEEKTGKRPNPGGLQPGLTLEGGKPQVTLNGLSSSDLGKLSMGELTSEVAARTGRWLKHTAGLLGTISSTKEVLEFEDDVLDALISGFKSGGWTPPAATKIPDAPAAGGASATPRS
jgi:hypothetical protein